MTPGRLHGIIIAVLFFCVSYRGVAQTTSRFSGQVTDQQGAAVLGASIEVVNQDTQAKHEAVSDDTGSYNIGYLTAGKYHITVSANNFKTSVARDVALGVDQGVAINVQLTVGSTATEVTVEGGQGATEINTASAEVSGTITGQEVASLALNGRNFTQLITLTPGVSNQSQQDEALVGPVGQAKYSFNGGRTEYNSFEVDGSDVLNLSIYPTSAPLIVTPSLDAIQEIKVLTSNYGAQYGRTASGVVQASTKSGTSTFHGDVYEFLRNEVFNSRNYFDPSGRAPLYRRNDFGGTVGGPIYIPGVFNKAKDKSYFFFSEEFRIDKTPTSYRVGAPSAAELKGDFSEFCPTDGSNPDPKVYPDCPTAYHTYYPLNSQQGFQANAGDANMYAIARTGLIPAANATTGCSSSVGHCYVASVSPETDWREELFRIDHDITAKHRLTLRYIHDAWNTTVLSPQWGYLGSLNTYPSVRNKFTGPGINVLASVASTLTQSILNSITISYTNSTINLTDEAAPGVNLSRPAQLDGRTPATGYNQDLPLGYIFKNGFGGKIPGIVYTGIGSDFGGGNLLMDTGYMPWEHTSPTYSITESATRIRGKHTIQAGAQFLLLQRNQKNSAVGSATGDTQGLMTFNAPGGNTFGNFLSGSQLTSYQQDSGQGRFHQVAFIAEPYVQDDWKVTPRFTANIGMRFSLFGNFHEQHEALYNWEASHFSYPLSQTFFVDPNFGDLVDYGTGLPIPRTTTHVDGRLTNGLVHCGSFGVPVGCQEPHTFNPAPRVGIAWDLTGKGTTAVRAGYGLFFEHGTPYESNTGSLEGNPPNVLSAEEYNTPDGTGCIGGMDSVPDGCPIAALQGALPLSMTSIPMKTKWAYAQQWNLSVQQQLSQGYVVTVAYVGSRATHLTAERQLNELQSLPTYLNPFGPHEPLIVNGPGDTCSNPVNGQFIFSNNLNVACAPNANLKSITAARTAAPGIDKIASLEPVADSAYHGFQFLGRRQSGSLTLDVAYTYSHSIDDSSDRTEIPVDGLNIHANKASSSFDQRHLFEVSYVYQLPAERWWKNFLDWLPKDAGKGWTDDEMPVTPGRISHEILDKWELSGLTLVQSGIPFSVYNSGYSNVKSGQVISAIDNAGVANGLSPLFASYPDLVGSAKHSLQSIQERGGNNSKSFGPLLLNPGAFAAPRALTFGNAGRNVLNNPRRTNFDASLLKHFTLPREKDLEFRAEGFNVFNHTQFRIYDPSQGNSPSNTISCYAGADANYSALGILGGDSLGEDCLTGYSFLHPFNAHRARTIQFGLKLGF